MANVFSEYDLRETGFKFENDETYRSANCTGSCEEEMEVKVITKMCRGVVAKKTVRGTGNGKLKLSMHMPYDIFIDAYGMELDSLKEGIKAYGRNSIHKTFSYVQHVFDEDEVEKFKAYPNCIIETGVVRKIENGAEEVAEVELEISVQPDEYGNGLYEALATELTDESLKTKWMTGFTAEMAQATTA